MRVMLATTGHLRGATSRTLEGWAHLLPQHGIDPVVSVGGEGPLYEALSHAGIPVSVQPMRVVPRRIWPFPFVAAAVRLALAIRHHRASVLHVNTHDGQRVSALAARIAGVPLVTHLRFVITADAARWLFGGRRCPARLFFTSATQMRDVEQALDGIVPKDRWRLLPNGLDFSRFGVAHEHRLHIRREWGLGNEMVALGTACAISDRKRVDHFIRLIGRLKASGLPVRGYVAGQPRLPEDRPLVDQLYNQARSLGVHEDIRFLGYVEPLEPILYAWDVSVSTSSYETFGMTVLESMGCSCPVVTYPGGSIEEVVGNAALVVPDNDEDALYAACYRLVVSREMRQALGRKGRQYAMDHYDVRTVVPRLAAEYRQAAQEYGIEARRRE
jgi:glycosyltransferase involved in cell wall biosynthesis